MLALESSPDAPAAEALPAFTILEAAQVANYEREQGNGFFLENMGSRDDATLVEEDLQKLCGVSLLVDGKPYNTCRTNVQLGAQGGRFDSSIKNELDDARNWLIECVNENSQPRWLQCNYGCDKKPLGTHDICMAPEAPIASTPVEEAPASQEPAEEIEDLPASAGSGVASPFEFVFPVTGTRNIEGWRAHNDFGETLAGFGNNHIAADFDLSGSADLGKPAFAIGPGIVATFFRAGANYRDYLIIKHNLTRATCKGDQVLYAHYVHSVARPDLRVGSVVRKGEQVSKVADNNTPWPHLHFEITNKNFNSLAVGSVPNGYANEYARGAIPPNAIYFDRNVQGNIVRYYNPILLLTKPEVVFGAPCR
jgi:murein DD-endopeptidase MepM/ murein hydrolase activator NlpD